MSLARAEIAEQPDALARVVADADGAVAAAAGTAYHRSRQVTWPRDNTERRRPLGSEGVGANVHFAPLTAFRRVSGEFVAHSARFAPLTNKNRVNGDFCTLPAPSMPPLTFARAARTARLREEGA